MKYKILILVIFFQACIGCKQNTNSIIHTDRDLKILRVLPDSLTEAIHWEEYVDSVKTIPLESNSESVFRRIDKLIYKHEKFFIHDQSLEEIFVFDSDGSFDSKLSKKGMGPGEYNDIKGFTINSDNTIIILDYQKVHKYDLNFNWLKTINFNESGEVSDFCFFDDSNFWTFNDHSHMGNESYMLYHFKNGKTDKIMENKYELNGCTRFIEHNNGYYLIPPFYDNHIYRVTEQEISKAYRVTFDGTFFTPEKLEKNNLSTRSEINSYLSSNSNPHRIKEFYESDNYITFNYVSKNRLRTAIFSKSNNETISSKRSTLFGELNILIIGYCQEEDVLIAYAEPIMLKNKVSKTLISEYPGISIIENIKENQNPVLFKLYMK